MNIVEAVCRFFDSLSSSPTAYDGVGEVQSLAEGGPLDGFAARLIINSDFPPTVEMSLHSNVADAFDGARAVAGVRINFERTLICEPAKRGFLLEPKMHLLSDQSWLRHISGRVLGDLPARFVSHLGLVDEHLIWQNELRLLDLERGRQGAAMKEAKAVRAPTT